MRAATVRAPSEADCARVLSGFTGPPRARTLLATRFINAVYPDARPIRQLPILRPGGSPVTKHDRERDAAITHPHRRLALKRFEIVASARLDFTLLVLQTQNNKPTVTRHDLERVMSYGGSMAPRRQARWRGGSAHST